LGFVGFKAFKQALIDEVAGLRGEPSAIGVRVGPDDGVVVLRDKVHASFSAILKDTHSILDTQAAEAAASAITGCEELYVIGSGTSGVSARYALGRFVRIGIRCSAASDPSVFKMKAAILGQGSVLLAISSSGRTRSIVEAARAASACGATVVSLSDYAVSPLRRIADISLFTTPRDVTEYLDLDMPLIVGQINIIEVVFARCCVMLWENGMPLYAATKAATDTEKL
jgi:RpiR family carbohydrate utilization transcriptional regulator